jgi:predicted nucleic acid-binding protein
LFTTAISEAELWYGVEKLPNGERRNRLAEAVRSILELEFAGRVLPFERSCAPAFGRIAAARRREGQPISAQDALIAAIAASYGAVLATRNISDFEGCGIELVNPWAE